MINVDRLAERTTQAAVVCGFALLATLPAGGQGQVSSADTLDVFFLGNSYVYYNNLADQLTGISLSLPGTVINTGHHLHGGFSLRQHLEDGHLPDIFRRLPDGGDGWDVVVVQEHSRLGVPYSNEATGSLGSAEPFFASASKVVDLASEHGAEVMFYMTWAKEEFPNQISLLSEAYTEAGRRLDATVTPVGLAWDRVRQERPDIKLFHPDGSHPSPAGTYLSACVFYSQLTGTPPFGATHTVYGTEMRTPGVVVSEIPALLVRLTEEVASYLQAIAWDVVSAERERDSATRKY